jgi:hypothetical protein
MSQNVTLNDVLIVQNVCGDAGQIAVLNRYFRCVVAPGIGATVTFTNVAQWFAILAGNNLAPIMNNGATYLGTRVRRIFPALLDAWGFDTTQSTAGTAGASALPKQTCGLARYVSATLGKHGEGRTYLPFPAAADNASGGVPTAGYEATALTYANDMAVPQVVPGTGGNATLNPVLWDRVANVSYDITGVLIAPAWATQRRRGDYGRLNKGPF